MLNHVLYQAGESLTLDIDFASLGKTMDATHALMRQAINYTSRSSA